MRVGIVGCGLIGQKRALALPASVDIVGCFDSVDTAAQSFATKFATKVFGSAEELFATKDIEFVIIATRHDSLASLAMAALKYGKHVLIEKPGGINENQLNEVFVFARERNLRVHVGYNHRYHPSIRKAIDLFRNGTIGEIMFVRGSYGHGGRLGYETEWRADKSISGGAM